jgi:GTP-binding protein
MPAAEARFLTSAHRVAQFLPDEGVEVAFAGRSNCGKSSAINAVLGRNRLARTSRTPGRTQLVNFFSVGPHRRVVDLPGYGYARVPQELQQHWRELLDQYFGHRRSLGGLVLVVDARRGLQDFDRQLLEWMAGIDLAVHIVLTKADKLGRAAATAVLAATVAEVGSLATAQLFSAHSGDGVHAARQRLEELLAVSSAKRAKKSPGRGVQGNTRGSNSTGLGKPVV